MTQRIAPNNQLPATHFIEVWKLKSESVHFPKFLTEKKCASIRWLDEFLSFTQAKENLHTYAIFRIRENQLPTKHNFNAQTQPHSHLHHGRDEIDQKETSRTGENETPRPPSDEGGEV